MVMIHYTIEQLKEAIVKSYSIAGVSRRLGLKDDSRAGYERIKKDIVKEGIDISHFLGQGHNKGKVFESKRVPISDYLENKSRIGGNKLREKLIEAGLKKPICENCNLDRWMDNPIPLHLHHKDRNHFNNDLENLQILCPNCHALAHRDTNRKPEKRKFQPAIEEQKFIDLIPVCYCAREVLIILGLAPYGSNYVRIKRIQSEHGLSYKERKIKKKSIRKSPSDIDWRRLPKPEIRKVSRPTKEELEILINSTPFVKIGEKYGVSDNAVRKWCRSYGIEMPKNRLGYWSKSENRR